MDPNILANLIAELRTPSVSNTMDSKKECFNILWKLDPLKALVRRILL